MSDFICPKCNGKFKEFRHKRTGVIFDLCQLCYATWFDKNELWTMLQNKKAKKLFKKSGLLKKKQTEYKCPKCQDSLSVLERGLLPLSTVEVEHCPLCESFLFDEKEYQKAKTELNESLKTTEAPQEVKQDDFSFGSFYKRLRNLNDKTYKLTKNIPKPDKLHSVGTFFSRMGKAFRLIFKEPEIILFSLFQLLAICIAYLIWVQMLKWIPEEVYRSAEHSDSGNIADFILMAWSFLCVGLAALPIGFLTACMGAVHILNSQGKGSTVLQCFKFSFPKIGPLWLFSWLDGWITVKRIVDRLPRKDDRRTAAQKILAEAMYYAWKVGTAGVIPSLITTKNTWQACKNSFGFLKHKIKDILLLRTAYSLVSWIIGILAYIGAAWTFFSLDIKSEEIYGEIYTIYFNMAFPIFIAVGFIQVFVRPFYVLSLFDLYSDYMMETQQKIIAPKKTAWARAAIWIFTLLILLVIFVFLFREELGIMEKLATPHEKTN